MKNVAVGPTWRPCLTLTIRKHSHVVWDTETLTLGCAIGFLAVRIFPTVYTRSGPLRLLVTCGEKTLKNFVLRRPLGLFCTTLESSPGWRHTRNRTNSSCRPRIHDRRAARRRSGGWSLATLFLTWSSDPAGWHWEHNKQKPWSWAWRRCPARSLEPTAARSTVNHSGGATRVTWLRSFCQTRRVLRTQAAPPSLPPTPLHCPANLPFSIVVPLSRTLYERRVSLSLLLPSSRRR